MLGRALCAIALVALLGACTGSGDGQPSAEPTDEADRARSALVARTLELDEARAELSRLESVLSATRMERDARATSRTDTLGEQAGRVQVLDDVVDTSRRQFLDVLGTNDRLTALTACAQALDTALNEAAVSGPLLADALHDAQRACEQVDVVAP